MAVFGYGRVSTKEQTAENQRQEIENAGHLVNYWYCETVSGKTSAAQRPQFAALLVRVRDGETLVVSKLDRLGRDAQDVGATVKHLAERNIKVIVLQLGNLDLASPAGKMMLTMLAARRDGTLFAGRTHPSGAIAGEGGGKEARQTIQNHAGAAHRDSGQVQAGRERERTSPRLPGVAGYHPCRGRPGVGKR